MWKRVISIFVAYCFVLSMAMPTIAAEQNLAFQDSPMAYSRQVNNGLVDDQGSLLPGGISLNLEEIETAPNRYDISLDLTSRGRGETFPPMASVLLLDTSFAAAQQGRLDSNIAAAKEFIHRTLTEGSTHQIALVVCHQSAELLAPLTSAEDKDSLILALDTLPQGAGLYLEQGLQVAAQALSVSEISNKQILLFTDGETTYSTKVAEGSVHLFPQCDVACQNQVKANRWRYDLAYVSEGTRVGQASGFNTDIFYHRVDYDIASCVFGNSRHKWNIATFPQNHGDTVLFEAEKIRNNGISMSAFATGAAATSSGGLLLQSIANNGLALAGDYDSLLALLTPPTAKRGFTKGTIRLNLGSHFAVDTTSIVCSQGTILSYQESTKSLEWDLGEEEKASFSFGLELAVEQPNFTSDSPLFSEGIFRYVDMDDHQKQLEMPNIALQGTYSTLHAVGVWVDSDGRYRSPQGAVVTDAALGKQVSVPVELLNSFGVNRWGFTPEFAVTGDEIVADLNYIPHPDSGSQLVAVNEIGTNQIIYFPFVKTNLSYQVEHYYEGLATPFHREIIPSVAYGTEVKSLTDSPQLAVGYHRIETHLTPAIVVSDDRVFRAVYAPDEQQRVPYSLLFYKDSVFVEQEDRSVPLANPEVTITPDSNRYRGYRLCSIVFEDLEDSASLTGIVTVTEHEFHLYYQSDLSQTLPYTTEYYEDGKRYHTENSSVWVGYPTVHITPPMESRADCKLVAVEFEESRHASSITGHITEEDSVFRVYYETKEPTLWPYTVYYFLDGILEDTEINSVLASNPMVRVRPDPQREGYKLEKIMYDGREERSDVSALITKDKNEFYVYYEIDYEQVITYQIEHYYDGVLDENLTQHVNIAKAQNLVTQVDYYEKAGYLFESVTPLLPAKISDGEKVRIYYQRDLTGEFDYTIRYYKDGVLASGETDYGRVPMANPSITIRPNPDKFSGYTLDYIRFGEATGKPSLEGIISETNQLFEVYYSSEQALYFGYQVEYYYDFVEDLTAREYGSVLVRSPQITTVPDKIKAGFSSSEIKTVPNLPHVITTEGESIRVYYLREEVEIKPPVTPLPPDTKTIEVRVEMEFYGLGQLEGTMGEFVVLPSEQRIVVGDFLGKREYQKQQYIIEEILISETVTASPNESVPPEPAPLSPTLGASEKRLGESSVRLGRSGEKTATPETRTHPLETNHFRLNQHDVFYFTKENQYEMEVIYRLEQKEIAVLPPLTVETVEKITQQIKTKGELPDKSSPPPLLHSAVSEPKVVAADIRKSGQEAGKQLKLPQTGGTKGSIETHTPVPLPATGFHAVMCTVILWLVNTKKEPEE